MWPDWDLNPGSLAYHFQFLQLKKNLCITWACFRNGLSGIHVIPISSSGRLLEMSCKIGKNSSKMYHFCNKNSKSP